MPAEGKGFGSIRAKLPTYSESVYCSEIRDIRRADRVVRPIIEGPRVSDAPPQGRPAARAARCRAATKRAAHNDKIRAAIRLRGTRPRTEKARARFHNRTRPPKTRLAPLHFARAIDAQARPERAVRRRARPAGPHP